MRYVELHCKSNFSFLEGASHPDELVERAAELGYEGLALTDRHSLAGVVRGWGAAKETNLRYLVGAEVHPVDAPMMVLWPTDRSSYGRLCRLISRGRLRREKGEMRTALARYRGAVPRTHCRDPRRSTDGKAEHQAMSSLADAFGDRGYLLCELHRGVDDAQTVDQLQQLSRRYQLPLVAAGDVHYHVLQRSIVHDCVIAIRNGRTVDHIHEERFVTLNDICVQSRS